MMSSDLSHVRWEGCASSKGNRTLLSAAMGGIAFEQGKTRDGHLK